MRYSPNGQGFVEFVAQLHREKHAAYGDSWKKRGEMLGIMANIARKMDRLGVAGGGDTAADTAIDLLVYLIKYRLWIAENMSSLPEWVNEWPTPMTNLTDEPEFVTGGLKYLVGTEKIYSGPDLNTISALNFDFSILEGVTMSQREDYAREEIVDVMMRCAYSLALSTWTAEEKAKWKADNDKRIWKGYDA